MQSTVQERARSFRDAHVPGQPLTLINAWSVDSALIAAEAGCKAIGTSSYAVAQDRGFADGQQLPETQLTQLAARIVGCTPLPVSVDIEAGYSERPEGVATLALRLLEVGVVGVNIEDGLSNDRRALVDPVVHQDKLRALRIASKQFGVPLFINARIDTFFLAAEPSEAVYADTLRRIAAYREAGADGAFVPGLTQPKWIERLCKESELPVNIMMAKGAPDVQQLAALGVARVSLGGAPFEFVRRALRSTYRRFLESGRMDSFS